MQAPSTVEMAPQRFRLQLWSMIALLMMALFFGGVCYGAMEIFAPVDMSCHRQEGHVACDVTTQLWPTPAVFHLTEQDLADAALVLVPQPYDHSFRQLALVKDAPSQASPIVLMDFSRDISERQVDAINDYLGDPSGAPVSCRVVAPGVNRMGLLTVQVMTFLCLAFAILAIARPTTIEIKAGRLVVRRSCWPSKPVVHDLELGQIADIAAVTRIPPSLAPFVASVPWRNIYRANALAVRLKNGEEVLITEWCRRSIGLHQRIAASLLACRTAHEASSQSAMRCEPTSSPPNTK